MTRPNTEAPTITAAPGEVLWSVDDEVIRALDALPSYRQAIIDWLALHGIDAWKVRAAAVAADANGHVRVEALVARLEGGAVKVDHVDVPLLRDPPPPMTGWATP